MNDIRALAHRIAEVMDTNVNIREFIENTIIILLAICGLKTNNKIVNIICVVYMVTFYSLILKDLR